jgi:predicted esterase
MIRTEFVCGIALALGLSIVLPAEANAGETLADLLKTEGKSENWMKGTERIRASLVKLDPDSPKVKKWLPAIRRRCATLMKFGNIGDYERATFNEHFEAMLEDLVAGKKPMARYSGQTLNYGYWSDHISRLTGAKIQVPPDYDADREYQMFMYYKMGGGMYWRSPTKRFARPYDEGAKVLGPHRPTADMCRKTPETFHAWSSLYYGVKGRQGVVEELKELTRAMTEDFAISPDRIFLSGFSDGGFTAMWLGTHYPHLVAGIAPEVANWQYGNATYFGFFNVPTLVVDGWNDGGYISENLARYSFLSNMGYDIQGIIGHHGHNTKPFETLETVKQIMTWAKSKRRDLNRKHIKYSTWNLAWNRAYWFAIQRMADPLFAAIVDAKVEDNTFHVTTKNIAVYQLDLNDKLVDAKKPVKVITNGEASYTGPYKEQLTVEVVQLPESKLAKTPQTPGGIIVHANLAAYNNDKSGHKKFRLKSSPWTWVSFTGGDNPEEDKKFISYPKWARPDNKVDEETIAENNLMIYGGPLRNKLAARMAPVLPVTFEKGKFSIGKKVYDQPENWVKFICANPLNPSRMVLIFAFNDPAAAAKVNQKGLKKMGLSPWGFRDGDCKVFNVKRSNGKYETDTYVFDSAWQAPDGTVIGTAKTPFAFGRILQLKANAIKEATGTEVGLYKARPGWNRWQTSLPEGPLTVHDIAVVSMLPEFIMTGELSGAALKSLITRKDKKGNPAYYSTVFPEASGAGYDSAVTTLLKDIDDSKTYKISAGYSLCDDGALGLGFNKNKMPSPHFYFKTLEEYDAQEGTSIRCRNLAQTELEVTEAVVRYIEKRGSISP